MSVEDKKVLPNKIAKFAVYKNPVFRLRKIICQDSRTVCDDTFIVVTTLPMRLTIASVAQYYSVPTVCYNDEK